MPRFEKNGLVVSTELPREAAELRSRGFREVQEKPKRVEKPAAAEKSGK